MYASNNITSCATGKRNVLLYDGYLHFPELEILIPSYISCFFDMHGLGKEDSTEVLYILYGVVDKVNASHFSNIYLILDINM